MPLNDEALLAHSLAELKRTGRIEFTGEFGDEITAFIPFAAWLKAEGLLEGRRVVTYAGMEPLYYFLGEGELEAKPDLRRWQPQADRQWPSNCTYTATRQRWHVMPDYRGHYQRSARTFDRPVMFVQNKFAVEWGEGPINYLPLRSLHRLLAESVKRFHVIYSRPRYVASTAGYSADENTPCDYPDLDVVRRFEGVEILEETCAASDQPYNLTKLQLLARAHVLVGVQGGGSHLMACFGNSLFLLYHRMGDEYPHAYAQGPYKYLSTPPPALLLARSREEFERGLNVLAAVHSEGGRFHVGAQAIAAFEALRV